MLPLPSSLQTYFFSTRFAPQPPVILGKKIYDHLSGYSDDELGGSFTQENTNISRHDSARRAIISQATASSSAATNIPPLPPAPQACFTINFWNSQNEIFDAPGFEIVKEDDNVVYVTTILSPPPWHRPKENLLVYEFAGPDDDE